MDDATLLFVHSPLVGPLTWRAVAEHLTAAGRRCLLPDLAGAMTGPAPYLPRIAAAVAAAADPAGAPIVLIGHSGAGPLLPGIADTVGGPVQALVYVDAGLPYPGQTWSERAPAGLVAHLRGLAGDGWLPPWHQWFPPDALVGLLPDPQLRERFVAELAKLPVDYFSERTPLVDWSGRAGYLLLSEAYRDDLNRAAERGLPVAEHHSHHLAMLTAPEAVAAALSELLAGLSPAP